jgi:hypothetical protein
MEIILDQTPEKLVPSSPKTSEKAMSGAEVVPNPQRKRHESALPMHERAMTQGRGKRSESQPRRVLPGTEAAGCGVSKVSRSCGRFVVRTVHDGDKADTAWGGHGQLISEG